MKNLLLLFCMALPLWGCEMNSAVRGKPLAKMTFAHVRSFPIYVAAYDVQEAWIPGVGTDQGRQMFVVLPGRAVTDYFKSRFTPAGMNGKLVVAVESSDVTRETVQSRNSVGAFLGVDKTDVYHITVTVRLISYDVGGFDQKEMKITARRDVSISEHVSLVEREKEQMKALDLLIDDLDKAVRQALEQEFHLMRR